MLSNSQLIEATSGFKNVFYLCVFDKFLQDIFDEAEICLSKIIKAAASLIAD